MFKGIFVSFVTLLLASSQLVAAEIPHSDASKQTQVKKTADVVFEKIGGKVKSVKPAPVKGLYEVFVEKDGKNGIFYLDDERKHLLQGVIIDLESFQPVFSHPQDMLQPKQPTTLDVSKIPVSSAFVMGNPKGSKKLYVFTDPDCPYCHKMHVELKKLVQIAPDVAINIMLFPLPMHPNAYDKSRVILESKSQEIMDNAFEGKEVSKPDKESSKLAIEMIIEFATANGIMGTPTLVMPDGKIEVGIKKAEDLKKKLADK